MDDPNTHAVRRSIAGQLVGMSLREHLLEGPDGGDHDPYRAGVRDAYAEAAARALDRAGSRALVLAQRVEDAVTEGFASDEIEGVAAEIVRRASVHGGLPTPRLEWMGPLAFRRRHPGPPGADNDFGSDWGELHDQRISLRRDIGATCGLLYAYDPTWNEYAVLGTDVPLAAFEEALSQLGQRHGDRTVEEFAASVAICRPLQAQPAGLAPVLEAEL